MASFNALSPADANFLEKMVKQATAEETYESTSINWRKLQLEARNFLVALEKLENERFMQTKINLKELVNGDPESSNYIQNYKRNKIAQITQTQYLLAFDFDAKITAFLGELPKNAVYVYIDSTGMVTTFQMSMAELAKRADKYGRLNIGKSALMSRGRTALEDQNMFDESHIAHARAAFMGTNARLNRYYEKAGMKGASAQGGLLMWKLGSEWTIARVANRGDLKEAYVSALMTQHKSNEDALCSIEIGSPQYYSHQLIATFFNLHIHSVTNKPAIVEEDVIGEFGQFAVKGSKAALPGLDQYIQTAEMIVASKDSYDPNTLKKLIEKMFPQDAHRNNVLAHGEKITDQALRDLGLSDEQLKAVRNIQISLRVG